MPREGRLVVRWIAAALLAALVLAVAALVAAEPAAARSVATASTASAPDPSPFLDEPKHGLIVVAGSGARGYDDTGAHRHWSGLSPSSQGNR